ncbi:RHS repeat-associated core domain-containing protein, partial [bacterium]|nr:RHS repeat-associated core domain-containing protein [bacterium]
ILGNNILLTDNTGGWVEKTTYGPFGDEIASQRRGRSISAPNGYKFTGKERDKESNLDYFGARYLDYNNGRFLKLDSVHGILFIPQSLNRYTFVRNRPLYFIDPDGEDVYLVFWQGGFSGSGHSGIGVDLNRELGKIQYYTLHPWGNVYYGDVDPNKSTIQDYDNIKDMSKGKNKDGTPKYISPTTIIRIKTDERLDKAIIAIYDSVVSGITKYSAFGYRDGMQCGHLSAILLKIIGIKLDMTNKADWPKFVKEQLEKYLEEHSAEEIEKDIQKEVFRIIQAEKFEEFLKQNEGFEDWLKGKVKHD